MMGRSQGRREENLETITKARDLKAAPRLSKKKVQSALAFSDFLVSQRSLFLRPALSHDPSTILQIHG
jgi:hypothetical protein